MRMVFPLVALKLSNLLVKSGLGLDDASLVFGVDRSVLVVLPVLLHEIGDDNGETPGHIHLAVYENVVFW